MLAYIGGKTVCTRHYTAILVWKVNRVLPGSLDLDHVVFALCAAAAAAANKQHSYASQECAQGAFSPHFRLRFSVGTSSATAVIPLTRLLPFIYVYRHAYLTQAPTGLCYDFLAGQTSRLRTMQGIV